MSNQTVRKLSAPRRRLLERLNNSGGQIVGRHINIPSRSLASRMSMDGLVRWERPLASRHANLDEWTLHIEPAGRAALTNVASS
jgi:hypothetical protein